MLEDGVLNGHHTSLYVDKVLVDYSFWVIRHFE